MSAVLTSCGGGVDDTPQEGKFNTSLVGTYDLTGAKITLETTVKALTYNGVEIASYTKVKDSLALINNMAALYLKEKQYQLQLKADGTFNAATYHPSDNYWEVIPDSYVGEDSDFPFVVSDFTWFSTSSTLYLAINRTKVDAMINSVNEPKAPALARVKKAIAKVTDGSTEDGTFNIEKYLSTVLYVSEQVYGLPVAYKLSGSTLTLTPIDNAVLTVAVAAVDAYFQDYVKTIEDTEDQLTIAAELGTYKSIAEQVLKDCKIQVDITLTRSTVVAQ